MGGEKEMEREVGRQGEGEIDRMEEDEGEIDR